jgi:hypothetical protein
VTYPGANDKGLLLLTLRLQLYLSASKPATLGLLQLFFPVTAWVCGHGRIWPSGVLLPWCLGLASDQLKLPRSKRAKGQKNLRCQVEQVWHSYGWWAQNAKFSNLLCNEESIFFHWASKFWQFRRYRSLIHLGIIAKQRITKFHIHTHTHTHKF